MKPKGPGKPAVAVLALARRIAPPAYADWFAAMTAEADHLPPNEVLGFACGCLFAALRARLESPDFINMAARQALVGGAFGWAALNLWFAGRVSIGDNVLLQWFALGIAAIFACGGIATARYGLRATIVLGAPLAVLLAISAFAVREWLPPTPATHLHLALLIEDLAVLLLALAIALLAPRLAAWRQAR